ncbi:CRISPR-associated endoribonuclease Cas6 [Belliella buryatensis]|uniref:CRISPR-associated endoribonuclease Cas6 n=1 Tax=Belliella buryatensis TaxID=1500549 RepID=A0A239C9N3_9BACT|nr:CRISPR-associated endoribonuclease Cas6 [Belliella buryatensis]SNS16331.1 CRISPR-associated endoribonuclease Cas6 [Belliella buryatensis]
MQFLIKLERVSKANQFALNYQYELSAGIEGIFEQADFSILHSFLGDESLGVRYIPFTFSQLQFDLVESRDETGSFLHLGNEALLDLRILVDQSDVDYLQKLILGQRINFIYAQEAVEYRILGVEVVPPPVFKGVMTYSAVTPVFLIDNLSTGGSEFIEPADARYCELFKNDLLKRFSKVIPELKELKNLDKFCPEIEFHPISKVEEEEIVFNMYQLELVHLKGYKYDFKLKASPLLQEFGYYAGFGAQNSLGFGCVNVKNLN